MKGQHKCRVCGGWFTWCVYRKDPRTGRKLYARDYGYKAWRLGCKCSRTKGRGTK